MPPVIRRRALSPRGLQTTTLGAPAPSRGRCSRLVRLTLFFGFIASLVYFAVGFREAVDAATEKMQALRSTTSAATFNSFTRTVSNAAKGGLAGLASNDAAKGGLAGLSSNDDVVELVRPKDDSSGDHDENHLNDDDGEVDDEVETTNFADEQAQDMAIEPQRSIEEDEPSEPQVKVIKHEEDDAPVLDASKVVTEDALVPASPEAEVEEDLDNEEHAVDDNAHDVVVEGTPGEEEDEDDEEQEQQSPAENEGPQRMPRYKREELEERGFGHVLYAYRVVAPYVAIRTKPSPIGALALTSKDKMGLTKDSVKNGDIVVGYKLAKVHGLWLKIGPYTWAPVTKKESADGPFHPVMKQIRKISIPGNLRKYWRMRLVDCEAMYKKADSKAACNEKNMIRNGVLNVMRRMKLIDQSMDPDVHPWPSKALPQRRTHATSMTDAGIVSNHPTSMNDPGALSAGSDSVASSIVPDESNVVTDEQASNPIIPQSSTKSLEVPEGWESTVAGEDAEQQSAEEPIAAAEEGEGAGEDDVDTDVECRQYKFWHLCARHAKCAWRRLPNLEYCDLDTDPPIDESTIPHELQQDPKFDFPSPKASSKYFIYQPSGGWNNQRLLMESALIICKLLNRTCILPPAAPHSNYFNNYNNIPPSALVGMPRVLNMDALNQVVSAVAMPRGVTFTEFLDKFLYGDSPQYSVKSIFRDVTKYKPGTMKKWGEKDIVRMFASETADVIYFVNQTLWGSVEWKGSLAGWPQRKQIQQAVMYPNHMKKIARKLAENLGAFHAVHIRRGDKVFETSFSRVYHDPEWYASRIVEYKSLAPKVYVATDEPNRSFFDAFKTHGMSMVFWESVPGYDTVLRPYLANFPKRMFMDVLGMIEQLLCSYASMFLGSGYSTFTTYILRLRKYREILAADTSFQDRQLGLPAAIRNVKSTCDPIKALTHSKPC